MVERDSFGIQRRVAGQHDFRLDGMRDLLWRSQRRSVFDIGCNRGMVAADFAHHGASRVHGCDIYEPGIATAREIFADMRFVDSRFEVVDLTEGPDALRMFGSDPYDITVMLATLHKLKRVMPGDALNKLLTHFARKTREHFAWRATSDKPDENEDEMVLLDRVLGETGLIRSHTSYLSADLGVCAIWSRP